MVLRMKNALMGVFIFLLLGAAVFVLRGYFTGRFNSAESLRVYIGSFGVFAPLVLIVIQALQVILPVLPGFLGCIVGAAMFGPAIGFWCNYIGISAGSIIAFYLARMFGASLVEQMVSVEKYGKLVEWVNQRKSYTVVLALAILLPLAPDDYFCYFSGLADMSARKFIWIIILAKPWCILAYSLLFAHFI